MMKILCSGRTVEEFKPFCVVYDRSEREAMIDWILFSYSTSSFIIRGEDTSVEQHGEMKLVVLVFYEETSSAVRFYI